MNNLISLDRRSLPIKELLKSSQGFRLKGPSGKLAQRTKVIQAHQNGPFHR